MTSNWLTISSPPSFRPQRRRLPSVCLRRRHVPAWQQRRDVECEEFLYDEHFTFVETATHQAVRRNPRIFSGRYITVTRWADGSYHPNFRPMPMREDLSLERYALGVYNELCMALGGLVEEE